MAKYGYIGNNPDNTPVIIARQSYTATADQTTFTFSAGYTPGYIDVYLNGVKLESRVLEQQLRLREFKP